MDAFPEDFKPEQFTDDDDLIIRKLRKDIFDEVSKKAAATCGIDIGNIDSKIVQKLKKELEELGWIAYVSEYQKMNASMRNLVVANPALGGGNGRRMRRGFDNMGGGARQPTMSTFAKRNMGAAIGGKAMKERY